MLIYHLLNVFYFPLQGGAADRTLSIGHGSEGITDLLKKSMQEFRFDTHWDFELNIKTRGMCKEGGIPNYYFRDDGLELWKAMKTYVQEVIDIFYLQDDDVKEDTELQEWMNEILR